MRHVSKAKALSLAGALVLLLPITASAQFGSISGQVKDTSGGALPGVTVEVTSPQLIEKVRSTTTDGNGRYQHVNLPVGTYAVTFKLQGFSTLSRNDVVVSSEITQPVNSEMRVGEISEIVNVVGEPPLVDVANARQIITFHGADLRELPTPRNVSDMLIMVPGIMTSRGICSGGVGANCGPSLVDFNSHASLADTTGLFGANAGLNQGRITVDGMIVNSPSPNATTGLTGGYVADVANAQEVSFNLSGALGESETGGAAINIVPRTGGNRFDGNYFTAYTSRRWFDRNNGSRNNITVNVPTVYDYDVNGAFGGPIVKDRVWFFANARNQGRESTPAPGNEFYPNASYGIFGKNYQPDRSQGSVTFRNQYRNVNLRLTAQASRRNKLNVFWDEQDSCQDPCYGVATVFTSKEAIGSLQTRPNHLAQVSWSNPLTNRLLLEAGLSATMQHFDTTRHREIANPSGIPRISESGVTAGADAVATRVNALAGGTGAGTGPLTSGSLNGALGGPGAEVRNLDSYRSRASASYITGAHNAKLGYDGGYFSESVRNKANDLRLTYNYVTPATTCASNNTCGNTSLYFPEDPNNTIARRPIPSSFDINTGEGTISERVWYGALYLQDQWTFNRFTLNGAIRYDHAQSRYLGTCIGTGGAEPYVPVQIGGAYDGLNSWCTEPSSGVNYNDITPRWGVAWDVFGNGRTSVKWNMGKYLAGATIGGQYNNSNPARRSVQTLNRGWQDTNGNRLVDCRIFDFSAHTDLGDTCNAITGTNANRYGRDPLALDASGLNASFFSTLNCGASNPNPQMVEYCNRSGDNLVSGWNARTYTYLFGLGVQHELLPRLSVEVTYNARFYGNQAVPDILGRGCDRFGIGSVPEEECQRGYLNYTSNQYDFYTLVAPVDPRLPEGGGYVIRGLNSPKVIGDLPNNGTVVAFEPDRSYRWDGFDTNFVLRARGGLRLAGGTSTGSARTDRCFAALDGPDSKGRVGNEYQGGCLPIRPFQTNMRANASYTIPWMDVLVSTVFQYRPGIEKTANLQVSSSEIVWEANSAERAAAPCTINGVAQVGCFYGTTATNTATVNLLDVGDLYGEGIRLFDLKFAKNIRFGRRRANIGVDIYNLFNSDAALGYNGTYTAYRDASGRWLEGDNPATAAIEVQNWGQPTALVAPRFLRFQLQFDF